MNGVILKGLKDLVVDCHGPDVWDAMHDQAGVDRRLYMPSSNYSDELVASLIDAAVDETGRTRADLLTDLGRSLVPDLLTIYGVHIRAEWSTLELLANLEDVFHAAFSANRFTTFEPPAIDCNSIDDDSVTLEYVDDRGLCALFEGILRGLGDQYDEPLAIDRKPLDDADGDHCEFVVALADEPSTEEPPVVAAE